MLFVSVINVSQFYLMCVFYVYMLYTYIVGSKQLSYNLKGVSSITKFDFSFRRTRVKLLSTLKNN